LTPNPKPPEKNFNLLAVGHFQSVEFTTFGSSISTNANSAIAASSTITSSIYAEAESS
jgi:hypothetical protein